VWIFRVVMLKFKIALPTGSNYSDLLPEMFVNLPDNLSNLVTSSCITAW